MFATLAGGYPTGPLLPQQDLLGGARRRYAEGAIDRPTLEAAIDRFVAEIVGEQVQAGLEFPCDGFVRAGDPFGLFVEGLEGLAAGPADQDPGAGLPMARPLVTGEIRWRGVVTLRGWRATAAATSLPAKAIVPGPYSFGRLTGLAGRDRERATLALAEAIGQELRALADAGCPIIQVTEEAAGTIGEDERERSLYWRAHRRLTDGFDARPETHLSLALTAGDVSTAGTGTFLDAPYRSYLIDLVLGPAAWRLVHEIPGDRGVICGVADARNPERDAVEVLVLAAAFAAAAADRGDVRVGIAPSGSLAALPRHRARAKLETLGEAVRLARTEPLPDVRALVDGSQVPGSAAGRELVAAAIAGREAAASARRGRLVPGRAAAGQGGSAART